MPGADFRRLCSTVGKEGFSKSWHLTNRDNHDDFGVSLNKSFVAQVLCENLPILVGDFEHSGRPGQTKSKPNEMFLENCEC